MRHWLRRSWLACSLLPLAGAGWLWLCWRALRRRMVPAQPLPVPVVVVGNLLVGSTGKTPVVAALATALKARGLSPGIVSRGYGRDTANVLAVADDDDASLVGDEPLLLRRMTGVPVYVGAKRHAAALSLCRAHPDVNVLISDDGLQHDALPKDFNIVVFDERGLGNGWLLPAGPLRQPISGPLAPRMDAVLYNAPAPSTPLAGEMLTGEVGEPWPLAGSASKPLGPRRLAAAGLGVPERFFASIRATLGPFNELALPDHARMSPLPWQATDWDTVFVTEKDAVKLRPGPDTANVWVVPYRVYLPHGLVDRVLATVRRHGYPSA